MDEIYDGPSQQSNVMTSPSDVMKSREGALISQTRLSPPPPPARPKEGSSRWVMTSREMMVVSPSSLPSPPSPLEEGSFSGVHLLSSNDCFLFRVYCDLQFVRNQGSQTSGVQIDVSSALTSYINR